MGLVNTPRYLALEEADGLCWYCGIMLIEPVAFKPHKSSTRTQDHVFPLALGGTSMEHNKVPCCNRCNQWKGARELEDFRVVARPGEGVLRLFYAEVRELELAAEGVEPPLTQRRMGQSKPFNDLLAEKLKAALG